MIPDRYRLDFAEITEDAYGSPVDFDAQVEDYLLSAGGEDHYGDTVTIQTTRWNAAFYAHLVKAFMGAAAAEEGRYQSPYQLLHRVAYVLERAAHADTSNDVENEGWPGPPTSR